MLTLLRKNNSDDITAFHDAVMNYAMFGDGVIDGVYDSLACAGPLNNVFSIKSGFILFGGRLCVIAKGTMQDINISSFSLNQKIYIYLKLVIASDDEDELTEEELEAMIEKDENGKTIVVMNLVSIQRDLKIKFINNGNQNSNYALINTIDNYKGISDDNILDTEFTL